MTDHNLDTKIKPTVQEQKWFNGHYNSHPYQSSSYNQPYYQNYWPTQHIEQPSFQMPYNLSKGQFEIWPMEALQQQNQSYLDPQVAYITQDTSMHYQQSNNVSTF